MARTCGWGSQGPGFKSRHPDMEQRIGCVILIFNKNGKLLLGKRKNVSYRSGYYGVPGGRVNPGEKLTACVKRELKEEVVIIPIKSKYIGFIKEDQQTHDFIHFIFTVKKWKGEIKNGEIDKCEGWEWYDVKKLPQPMFPGHEKAIELYYNKIENYIEC